MSSVEIVQEPIFWLTSFFIARKISMREKHGKTRYLARPCTIIVKIDANSASISLKAIESNLESLRADTARGNHLSCPPKLSRASFENNPCEFLFNQFGK